ncbi:hypothetical protein LCGC14_2629290, partial [marine sediment metagenome]
MIATALFLPLLALALWAIARRGHQLCIREMRTKQRAA